MFPLSSSISFLFKSHSFISYHLNSVAQREKTNSVSDFRLQFKPEMDVLIEKVKNSRAHWENVLEPHYKKTHNNHKGKKKKIKKQEIEPKAFIQTSMWKCRILIDWAECLNKSTLFTDSNYMHVLHSLLEKKFYRHLLMLSHSVPSRKKRQKQLQVSVSVTQIENLAMF